MPIDPGQQLLHYRLIDRIGQGGMGVVWKAEDTKLQRHVALKMLPEAMAADPDRRARFEREARAVAALNHPNIVTLHSVEQAVVSGRTVHFITMELVEGRTLSEILPRDGFPLKRLLEIAIPLTDAVSRAHRAGITHRDLKPDNIMIDGEGRLRVLDFGLAKLQESVGPTRDTQAATVTSDTAEGRVLGTAAYMSPEQAEGKEVDARSDIFSLGTILYELASGRRPFRGDTTMGTLGAILKDEPDSITDVVPSLPRHAGRIIRRCLSKVPDRRYQTALDLRNELEELRGEIESGVYTAASGAAEVPARRSRFPLLAGAVVLLAVAVVLLAQLWKREGQPQESFFPRPITAAGSWDFGPVWSPDGRFVAFERMTAGNLDIYVQPVAGGEAVVRADGPGEQFSPRWTPDGRYLTYVSRDQPGTPLLLIPADGGNPRQLLLTDIAALDFNAGPMGDRPWSSDGKTLLVAMPDKDGRTAVHRVDGTTAEAEQITFPPPGAADSFATYSFDGERILFRRQIQGLGNLMLMPAGGGDPELLLQGAFFYLTGAWRPDNRRVVFTAYRGGSFINLFEIDVDTREIRRLTNETRDLNSFSVGPDDTIAFAPFWHDQFIHVVEVESGDRVQITSHAKNNGETRFAPDGRTIVYTSNRTGGSEIWLHHLDDGTETRFTDDEFTESKPDWSPDGKRIVFGSDRDGGVMKLFVAPADGGTEPRLLVDRPLNFGQGSSMLLNNPLCQWSPDGELIAYRVVGPEGPELWTVGPDGMGATKRLDGVTGFDWYDGSRRGLITRTRGTEEELLAVDLETGEERSLLVGALQEIDVAPDRSAVAFGYGRGHLALGLAVLELEASPEPGGLPRAVGEPRYVVPTEGTFHIHGAGWSPDSKRIVYVEDTDYGDIYALERR